MAADKKQRDEQDLERYGVWVKAGPDDIAGSDNASLDLMDIEDSGQEQLLITEEEEQLLGELEESSLPDFSKFDDAFGDEDIDMDDPFADDISASGASEALTDGESKELLHKIEDELNSLRDEIRQLKDELSGLRVPAVGPPVEESHEGGGFFEDEDDETIALTGDELDNILDSADMTEETAESETAVESAETSEDIVIEGEDAETDLSDFTELELDDIENIEDIEIEDEVPEDDPALSILGSPDEPQHADEPDTIEIDIPGPDETIDLSEIGDEESEIDLSEDEEPVVSIDDISEEFEDVTDLDDFGMDSGGSVDLPLADDEGMLLQEPGDSDIELTESFDDDVFDEGEEVEIDLSDDEEIDLSDDAMADMDMEEVSLEDFDLGGENESVPAADSGGIEEVDLDAIEESDVLAIGEDEEIDLGEDAASAEEVEIEDLEEVELESVLSESIEDGDLGAPVAEDTETTEGIDDLEIEEIDLGSEVEDLADAGAEDLEIEEIDLGSDIEDLAEAEAEDLEIEEFDLGSDVEDLEIAGTDDLVIEEIDLAEEVEDVEDLGLEDITAEDLSGGIEEIPEISLDNAIDEIESADEFSIDMDEDDAIEELEIDEADDESEIRVTVPDDDFNELPGTEEVDLASLEALASAPDLTEGTEETVVELPETPAMPNREALQLGKLPGELKDDIKEVLRYMDQLLESLPEDKIQEFARSEHYEVYKKIFEELGISD